MSSNIQFTSPQTVTLHPCDDPWAASRERYWDIDGNQYNDFIDALGTAKAFSYKAGQVSLTYDQAPDPPYFVGRIQASGLKPNFCYQLKLTGKPERGPSGWGSRGDDWSNEALGFAGRWWCDTQHAAQTNFNDDHFRECYKDASSGTEHNMYGYLYMGCFVTDGEGNADLVFTGSSSYHVDWKETQLSDEQRASGAYVRNADSPFVVQNSSGYGYGAPVPTHERELWYEYEPGRAHDTVKLPAGQYRCRLLITEESFHDSAMYAGYWRTVLASEDLETDQGSEIAFTIAAG